jgi:hypothetical protein
MYKRSVLFALMVLMAGFAVAKPTAVPDTVSVAEQQLSLGHIGRSVIESTRWM